MKFALFMAFILIFAASLSCAAPQANTAPAQIIIIDVTPAPEPSSTPYITLEQAIERLGTTRGNEHIKRGEKNIAGPDLGIVTSISFENRTAEWDNTMTVGFSHAPELRLSVFGNFLPTSKIAYADLTQDGEPEVIILAENLTINVEPIDGYFAIFIFTKQDGQYTRLTTPKLDDGIELIWGPFYPDDADHRFPDDPRSYPWFLIEEDFIRPYLVEDPEMIERGFRGASLGSISDFDIVGQDGKTYVLTKQAATTSFQLVGYFVSVLCYEEDSFIIKDKRLFTIPK